MLRASLPPKRDGLQLLGCFDSRLDSGDKIVKLDPMVARGPANELERLLDAEPVALRDDALRLFDCDAGDERSLQLSSPLERGAGD